MVGDGICIAYTLLTITHRQSSNLVIRDPTRTGWERCLQCAARDEAELGMAVDGVQQGEPGADERVKAIQHRSACVLPISLRRLLTDILPPTMLDHAAMLLPWTRLFA